MKQYKHVVVESGPWINDLTEVQYKRMRTSLDDDIGAQGYRMIDYHQLTHFTVLVFERDDAPEPEVSDVPIPKIDDYGPVIGFGVR